jgi:hypothetical protein
MAASPRLASFFKAETFDGERVVIDGGVNSQSLFDLQLFEMDEPQE